MNSCQQCQALLLEHLYGLLEGEERQTLEQHLLGCPSCQAALEQAKAQQRLLAQAARAEFPEVRFEAPADTLPMPATTRRPTPRSWLRYAVAACLLLTLGTVGGLAAWWYQEGQTYQNQYARAETMLGDIQDAQRALNAAQDAKINQGLQLWQETDQAIVAVQEEYRKKLDEAERTVRSKQVYMRIDAPETYQPGAPNTYKAEVKNLNNDYVPAKFKARVLDQTGQVVYEEKDIQTQGQYTLSLPPNLEVKPGADLKLEMVAWADNGKQVELAEKLTLAKPMYVTHLTTDKPMYQPGETVYFRSLTLDRFSLKPAPEDFHLIFTVADPLGQEIARMDGVSRLMNEQRQEIKGPDGQPVRGIGSGAFEIPVDYLGGEYTLTVSEASSRFLPQQRKFLIQHYQKHNLNKTLEFGRKTYGPGEEVIAFGKVTRAEGGLAVANRPVTATIDIDGQRYDPNGQPVADHQGQLRLQTDAEGNVRVAFRLPERLERGQGSLTVAFQDGGNVESIVRPIPIVLRKLLIEFFPEGGKLVAGVPNRVYFQVRTPLGKPADLTGYLVDGQGRQLDTVARTLNDEENPGVNQGMGLFEFIPQAGEKYQLRIDTPSGIEGEHWLPDVATDGVVMSVPSGVTSAKEPIRVLLHSAAKDRDLLVGVYCRGRLLEHRRVHAPQMKPTEVELKPAGDVGGVYRITVFEDTSAPGAAGALEPMAERLVYRQPANRLNIAIKPDKPHYTPGDPVRLNLSSTNEKGQPAPAILLVAVVDKSVVVMADEKTARSMPTHFLLTTEVRRPEDLEHADFLVGDHPKAAQALDLLLGTQGWRRFAEQDPQQFKQQHHEEAERLLVTIGQMAPHPTPQPADAYEQARRKVAEEFEPKVQELQQHLAEVDTRLRELEADDDFEQRSLALQEQEQQASAALLAARQTLREFQERGAKYRGQALLAVGALLLFVSVVCLLIALTRSLQRGTPYLATGLASLGLSALVLLGTFLSLHLSGNAYREVAMISEMTNNNLEDHRHGLELHEELGLQVMPMAGPDADPALLMDNNGMGRGQGQADAGAGEGGGKAEKRDAGEVRKNTQVDGKGQFGKGFANDPWSDKTRDAAPMEEQRRRELRAGFYPQQDEQKAGMEKLDGLRLADRAALRMRQARAGYWDVGKALKELQEANNARHLLQRNLPNAPPPSAAAAALAGVPADGRMLEKEQAALAKLALSKFYVRQYAHQHFFGDDPKVRRDFTETLYWHPVLVLPDGKNQVSFELCDSLTSFQVLAVGHTIDGRLGSANIVLESRKPFTVDAKVPLEVTANDILEVPVTIANNSDDRRQASLTFETQGLTLLASVHDNRFQLEPQQRVRRVYRFQPTISAGEAVLTLRGVSEPFATDEVRRAMRVVPEGFPVVASQSDILEGVAENGIALPPDYVQGTLQVRATVYLSTLADLQNGLDALLREPHGCFEQTSTSNYPNLLILDYLREHKLSNPEVESRAMRLLDQGYQKLTQFECKVPAHPQQRQGYEWFGGSAPPHEALTAYGLLQFRDMAKVYQVDEAMVERTQQYLLAQRDGQGGFHRNARAIDSFGRAPEHVTNAYIVWALTESDKDAADPLDVSKELNAVLEQAKTNKDPYFIALVANSLLNRDRTDDALPLLRRLVAAQQPEGLVAGAQTSITRSGGRDLQIETTALTVLAWLKFNRPEFTEPIQSAVKWIGQQRGGYGGYGSTQSTILALKALLAVARDGQKKIEAGELTLAVGDQVIAKMDVTPNAKDSLVLEVKDPEKYLQAGPNDLRLTMTNQKESFPYTLTWSYHALKPASAEACPVRLTTQLNRAQAEEEETVRLTVTVANVSGQGQGMTMAIVGLPAGLELPPDKKQLRDHVTLRDDGATRGLIDAWELNGRELILYWRDLAPDQKIEVPLDLTCRIPGVYRGPASRGYLYYNADLKHWIEPVTVTIMPKGN
ncbi:MAG: alpha-2-macroglobulin family protein [Gemmataceae bacterium]